MCFHILISTSVSHLYHKRTYFELSKVQLSMSISITQVRFYILIDLFESDDGCIHPAGFVPVFTEFINK